MTGDILFLSLFHHIQLYSSSDNAGGFVFWVLWKIWLFWLSLFNNYLFGRSANTHCLNRTSLNCKFIGRVFQRSLLHELSNFWLRVEVKIFLSAKLSHIYLWSRRRGSRFYSYLLHLLKILLFGGFLCIRPIPLGVRVCPLHVTVIKHSRPILWMNILRHLWLLGLESHALVFLYLRLWLLLAHQSLPFKSCDLSFSLLIFHDHRPLVI